MNGIFTHFLQRSDSPSESKRLAYAAWFLDAIPPSEFDGDERLFYNFMDYCVALNLPIKFRYLQVWLTTELKPLLMATKIRVPGCEALSFDDPVSFETIYQTTSEVLQDDFRALETRESEIDDFVGEIAGYFSSQRELRLTQTLSETFNILNSTESSDEAASYALDTINAVKDIYDISKLEDLNFQESNEGSYMTKVTDSGLPAIDQDSGGIYTTQLFDIEAQAGAGKTRFVLGTYVYRALTEYKKNVLFCALEQNPIEVKAMLTAHHVFRLFNVQVSDKMITSGNVPQEVAAQVEAAEYDLFKSGKWGKFVVKELDLYVETFISKLRTLDKLDGPFDLVCIDYMGLLESKPAAYQRAMTEYEIIKTGFRKFKQYLRKSRKAGISISQFNREGVQAGKADKEITTEMAQGGLAVYRNTDYNIAISMTDTMKVQQKRRFSQPKVRASAGFSTFIADTRLGFCFWRQVVNKEV